LPRHLSQMLLEDDIQVVGHYLSDDEMASLMNRCSIFLLPAARIHVVSVLGAMAYGQALVVSDGWGMEEYVQHGKTGLIVPGRAGRTSWMDHPHGMLREDYSSMFEPNEEMVERLVTEISRLVEEVDLRRELGFAARLQVANHHSLERWNRDLSKVLEKVLPDFRSEVCHVG
ncbi:MAG: glycosyltransferase, partial [Gemmataceae bacterium]